MLLFIMGFYFINKGIRYKCVVTVSICPNGSFFFFFLLIMSLLYACCTLNTDQYFKSTLYNYTPELDFIMFHVTIFWRFPIDLMEFKI